MKNRIQLLDIAIDIDSTKVAAETTIQCLEEESSKVIYFVNSETLLLLQENKDWKEVVQYPLVQRFCWLQRVKSIFCLCRRVFMPKDRI